MKTIAERLKTAREWKGWKQAQLAVAADVSTGTIGNIEAGIRQSKGSIPQIAHALGVNYRWLATGDGEMIPASNPPLAPVDTSQTAINNVAYALQLLAQSISASPSKGTDALAGMLVSLSKDPANPIYTDMLAKMLQPVRHPATESADFYPTVQKLPTMTKTPF